MGLVTLLGACLLLASRTSAQDDTFGNKFALMFLNNLVDRPIRDSYVEIHVYNPGSSQVDVSVKLPVFLHSSCSDKEFSVAAGEIVYQKLCKELRQSYQDNVITEKLVRVSSSGDIGLFAYNADRFSADGTLVWPLDSLGLYHTVATYFQPQIATQFGIAIPYDNTTINIHLPTSSAYPISIDLDGIRYTRGQTLSFKANAGSTFLAYNYYDLSGTTIKSSQPVVVLSGNKRTWTDKFPSRDYLVEQIQSSGKWGTEYFHVPTPRNVKGDVLLLQCRKNTCAVVIYGGSDGFQTYKVLQGSPLQLEVDYYAQITCNGQLQVSVIVKSQNGAGQGSVDPADPAFYFLPSVAQWYNNYRTPIYTYTVTGQPFDKVFILVAIRAEEANGLRINRRSDFIVDWQTVPGGSSSYVLGAISISTDEQTDVTHIDRAVDFMCVHYGAADRESFAVVLGSRSGSFVPGCYETPNVAGDGQDNDCDGASDEEICDNNADDDNDGHVDEDCAERPPDAIGTRFAVAFMSNNNLGNRNAKSELELYFTALEADTTVTVTAPAHNTEYAPNRTLLLTVGEVTRLTVDPSMKLGDNNDFSVDTKRSRIGTKGILVEANKGILLYGVNKRGFSTDSFSCIPMSSTGTVYRPVMQWPISKSDDGTLVAIVSHEDSTMVFVGLRPGVEINLDGIAYTGPHTFPIQLDAFHTVELQSNSDLSGIFIENREDKRFSVFAGNIRNKYPLDRPNRDHLAEQMPAVDTWGTEFCVTSSPRQQKGDIYKIVSASDDTLVRYRRTASSSVEEAVIAKAGDNLVISSEEDVSFEILSNKPVLLAQFVKSAVDSRDRTDPAMIIISPVQQWSRNYQYITPTDGKGGEYDNTIWVIVRPEYVSTMELVDGSNKDTAHVRDMSLYTPVQAVDGVSRYVARIIGISHGSIKLLNTNPDARYLGVMFGVSDRESYGNQISQQLRVGVIGCRVTEQRSGDLLDNDCDGMVDEEFCNGIDDDRDLEVDEDCAAAPEGHRYYILFEENVVERMRFYPLEVYVSNGNPTSIQCRLYTPKMFYPEPHYDKIVTIETDSVQAFALSPLVRLYGTGLSWKSVIVDCDGEATVMGVNKETYSNDAFIAYSSDTLGQEYYTMSYAPAHIYTQFAVIAVTEGRTSVSMALTAEVSYRSIAYPSGSTLSIDLDNCEVFQAQSQGDLSGTFIRSDKKIAVFGGNIRTNILHSKSRDHLASQFPATQLYGMEFNVAPSAQRTTEAGDVYRIVAREDITYVTVFAIGYGPSNSIELQAGSVHQFESPQGGPFHVSATRPIMIVQMQTSQASPRAEEKGDPCMAVIFPEEHYTNKIILATPIYTKGAGEDLSAQYENHVSLVIPTGTIDGMQYDGKSVNELSPDVMDIQGTSSYQLIVFQIDGGFNFVRLQHTDIDIKFTGRLEGMADRETYCVSLGKYSNV